VKKVLLCYDGSDGARHAIEHAAALLGRRPAVVLTVWESLGSAVLRRAAPGARMLREVREVSEDVIEALDSGVAEDAQATASEGAELASAAGFDAVPEARRAVSKTAERDVTTVWRAILDAADEHDASALVLGSRGRSAIRSALLGSVSYGVIHHSARSVIVVPPPA
jgi:nucleotide-binding universal stress UspA family protein